MLLVPEPFRPARSDWLQAGAVAAVLFALYALTSPRSIALEDDSLFVLSSYFLGIEHPPGYPLFTLIGHLFTYLPFGSVAYRVHLASALFGALSGAAAWFCARSLIPGRLPAYLAAFALGLSPVFWSQSIIAEVYTLNTFFLLVLVYLGLRAHPPLAWMAFLFGLSLSNHWPLMLLAAPAFAVLLWPLRAELLRRIGVLVLLLIIGLLPYVWMVRRSWMALPISFYGPLESLPEIWFFVSRQGYAGVDQSVSADWLDRVKFFQFLGGQLLLQFAVVGTLLAGVGFAVQWRVLGRRIGAFLTLAFLMSSAVLLLLLGFDYSSVTTHIFHVYPLPAYAVAALWLGLGFAWVVNHYSLRRTQTAAAGAALLALMLAVGARTILLANYDWAARYAHLLLKTAPPNAVVIGQGEAELLPMAYFHMIENWRPDITLYQHKGLVLGNRPFLPLRTGEEDQNRILAKMIEQEDAPVIFTLDSFTGFAQHDRWIYIRVDKSSTDHGKVTVDIPEEAVRFFEEDIARANTTNDWIDHFQNQLRHRYATLLARSLRRDQPPEARTRRHIELLEQDFYGAMGLAEGLLLSKDGYSVGAVTRLLEKVSELMPSDAPKAYQSRFFYVRGKVRADLRDTTGAIQDFETAFYIWPAPPNPVITPLEDLYRRAGNTAAADALQERVKRLKPPQG